MVANLEDVVCDLEDLGFFASLAHDPSDLWVQARHGGGDVVLALDFNVSGWEAAWNPPVTDDDHDQKPLHAWLSADADTTQVALWAAALAYNPRRVLDVEANRALT